MTDPDTLTARHHGPHGPRDLASAGDVVGLMGGVITLRGTPEPQFAASAWSHALGLFVLRGGAVAWEGAA